MIDAPDGTRILNETMNRNTSYSFKVSQAGSYRVIASATPQGSISGEGSLEDTITIPVKEIVKPDFTVTFDAQGGTVSTNSKTITDGQTYGTLPTPQKIGYRFMGWYTSATGGTKITETTTFSTNSNETLYAHWENAMYTIYFDANGGSCKQASKAVTYNSKYGTLPVPVKDGYDFTGWVNSSGVAVTENSVYSDIFDSTLYAQWTPHQYLVKFDANGGTCSESSRYISYGETYGTLPTPEREGFIFSGWYDSNSQRYVTKNNFSRPYDTTLVAEWTGKSEKGDVHVVVEEVRITESQLREMNYQVPVKISLENPVSMNAIEFGLQVDSRCSISKIDKTSFSTLLKEDGKAWFTCARAYPYEFDTLMNFYVTLPSNAKIGDVFNIDYLQWCDFSGNSRFPIWKDTFNSLEFYSTSQNGFVKIVSPEYQVMFDANGGTVSADRKSVTENSTYGTLPTNQGRLFL